MTATPKLCGTCKHIDSTKTTARELWVAYDWEAAYGLICAYLGIDEVALVSLAELQAGTGVLRLKG